VPQDAQLSDRVVVATEDARSVRDQRAEAPIYANRIKVYPKAVDGTFRRLRQRVEE